MKSIQEFMTFTGTDQSQHRMELESISKCPICKSSAREVLHTHLKDLVFYCAPGIWTLYRCRQCGSAYLDPRPTQESIHLAYKTYYTHETPEEDDIGKQPSIPLGQFRHALRNGYLNTQYGYSVEPASKLGFYVAHLFQRRKAKEEKYVRHLSLPSPGARLLDVGCGNGTFLIRMRSAGWQVYGVDPDQDAIAWARRSGLSVYHGTLDTVKFEDGAFDAITMNHVIEHLHDPFTTLKECYRILRPGGVLWIATPNLMSRGYHLFNHHWLGLDVPRHLVLFTPKSLKRALQQTGFYLIQGPLVNWSAEWMFPASYAISQALDPINKPPELTLSLKWRVVLSNVEVFVRPECAEELILLAQKPTED